ncbi:hypothetical protein [Nocardioides litoris]|uniref:hypothetical protein n=1 Tax=Nocardioides litoris TaxID=1926648 RepID=UPI00111FC546|nr:hypothetical protein [Nocardioides litoris]
MAVDLLRRWTRWLTTQVRRAGAAVRRAGERLTAPVRRARERWRGRMARVRWPGRRRSGDR